MRIHTLLRRVRLSQLHYKNALKTSEYNAKIAGQKLAWTFGPTVQQLPPSLRIELLSPTLQRETDRSTLFDNLAESGQMLLGILVNEHLRTRNVEIPTRVMRIFCDSRGIGAELPPEDRVRFLYQCIGASNVFVGSEECAAMVKTQILEGVQGLSKTYLDALSKGLTK